MASKKDVSDKEVTLKDVVDKLIELIALHKAIYREKLKEIKKQIIGDDVSRTILELADGSREYSSIVEESSKLTGKSERTVQRRISELLEIGAIRPIRKGRKVYYVTTGLYD